MYKVGKEGRLQKDGQERDNMIKKPFTIQFPENPVSGFSWDIATSNGLQIMRDSFVPGDEEKTGSGGYHVWDIQVTCQGSQKIMPNNTLNRSRSLEPTQDRLLWLKSIRPALP